MKKVAISIGDLNGIGIEIALRAHHTIKDFIEPIYCIDNAMLTEASRLLNLPIPQDFQTTNTIAPQFTITPACVTQESGAYSFTSFQYAIDLARAKQVDAIMTLPIHKKAWELANIPYKGHTDALRDIFQQEAIMMLGAPPMYVALFTEHIPLKEVANSLTKERLVDFLLDFYRSVQPKSKVALLGLNPHAGDDGVLGDEEAVIKEATSEVHQQLNKEVFTEPLVPDVAFTPHVRAHYTYYIAMYHDQGLAPLKALYFDESINVSLNLPIVRTSVDHGTAFDIAYKNCNPSLKSYINALKYIADKR
jgi:4-hydroxythreonine-4-phosphate dehydrogenase